MTVFDRREFLKLAATSSAAAGLLGATGCLPAGKIVAIEGCQSCSIRYAKKVDNALARLACRKRASAFSFI